MQPDFLIIGAARCGTSSLYRLLTSHPRCLSARTKEVHYFDLQYDKPWSFYIDHFARQRPFDRLRHRYVTGEASPYYLYHPDCAVRIRKHLPKVLIIALLRNPVVRAYSQYTMQNRLGLESRSFEQALNEEQQWFELELAAKGAALYEEAEARIRSYISRGIYAGQLERYLEQFPRAQVLLYSAEEYYSNTEKVANEILDRLQLPRNTLASVPSGHQPYPDIPQHIYRRWADFFAPHNAKLYRLIGRDLGW